MSEPIDLYQQSTTELHVTEQKTIVEPVIHYLEFAAAGPQGPRGPAGAAGGEALIYDRNGVPAQIWSIFHDRGRYVDVTVLLDSGEEVSPDVNQPDMSNVVITFGVPTSGKAVVI